MLKIHFLNVGDGDCCILEFPDRTTMVDINASKDIGKDSANEMVDAVGLKYPEKKASKKKKKTSDANQILSEMGYELTPQDPIDYLKENNIKSIFRFISTHPHMDHLKHFGELTQTNDIANAWIIKNKFKNNKKLDKESRVDDWKTYTQLRDNASTSIEEKKSSYIHVLRPMDKSSEDFYNEDNIKILSPTADLVKLAEKKNHQNFMSYILLIEWGHHKIVLGGDGEKPNWKYVMEHYKDQIKDVSILKASHHGRETGFYEEAVRHMNPKYTILSVGNTIQPKDDATKLYKEISENVITTRWKGNVVLECPKESSIEYKPQYK